ncbi:TRPM8 channel-associated factor homolog [Aplochiton taeniatus]
MAGLKELDLRGPAVPSDLVLIGGDAFPLVMNTRGQVLMAASVYGSGRLVVLGHEGYLTKFPALVENTLRWLRGPASTNPCVGIHQSCRAVADNLSRSSYQAEVVGAFSADLGARVAAYVTDAYSMESQDVKGLMEYLKAGGGVLLAGQAWCWAQQNPKENTLRGFPGNRLSGVAGVFFSEHQGGVEYLPVYPQIPSSWLAVSIGKDFQEDLEFLLEGVSEFDIQGGAVPSELLVHGPLAFPIGSTPDGHAFLAGAYYGQGRVIAVTHEGYLGKKELAPFWLNAIGWLDEGRNGLIGCVPSLQSALSAAGVKCEPTGFRKDLSVYVCTSYCDMLATEIQNFVAEGGGLLIGGHGWWWAQSHPGQNPLTDYPGNHILNKMGLSVLGSTLNAGLYPAPSVVQTNHQGYHFRRLLRRFTAHVAQGEELTEHEHSCLQKLGGDCANYLNMKATDCSSYRQLVATLTNVLKKSGMPQVCSQNPVTKPMDHLLLNIGSMVYKVCPDPDALLPYLIKDNPMMAVVYNHRVSLNVKTAGGEEWISTGLYLSPGMKTYLSIPPEIINKGWAVQIGCQTDHLGAAGELRRAPCVHERVPVTAEMEQVWNLWGGLIYLVAPPNTQVDNADVIVQVAVPAPYYKSGVTKLSDWPLLRTAPAPWAEIECENIILTLPSEVVRNLDRPDEVAALWDDIMRGVADLAAVPRKFPRKERFVADVQISHGFMHAGYPVMMQTSSAAALVSPAEARSSGIWGAIHELGHNQQRGCWEFPSHTTECTCNLWSVYVHEEVLGVDRATAHPNMCLENRKARAKEYVNNGRNLSGWDMWVALETYMQLQDRFGWDAFRTVFAQYHTMSNFPNDNQGKMNLYTKTFSQVVGLNLAGFFKAWGWPIEADTEEQLSNLPAWSDHPMVQYG